MPREKVVPLFESVLPVADEVPVGRRATVANVTADMPTAMDLSNKPKLLFLIGAGNTGKTTLARYLAEQAATTGSDVLLAAIDPENRELGHYFDGVYEPPNFDPGAVLSWLERFIGHVMAQKATAVIDLGGGDTALSRLVAATPDLVTVLQSSGVEPVAIYVLSPRTSDLSALDTLEHAGFQPPATALLLNEGRVDPTVFADVVWAPTRRHSVFRGAVDRGAVVLTIPRLLPAQGVELRQLTFAQAAAGTAPAGVKVVPMDVFDRSRVTRWLADMETNLKPIASWLP
jgi:hypothetical protein